MLALLRLKMIYRIANSLSARLWRITERRFLTKHRQALAAILRQHSDKPVWVFPPGLGWQNHLFQRPQQLALALARQGVLVFYVEPEHSRGNSGFHLQYSNLYLCRVPLATFQILGRPFIHLMTWNYKHIPRFIVPRVVYDFVDELSVSGSNRARLEQQHATLLQTAIVVLVTAERLYQQVQSIRPDVILCPNGVDYGHFAPARLAGQPAPDDFAPIVALGKPVVGYYGALARWFDYELVKSVALRRPDMSFVLIGPQHNFSLGQSGLLKLSNVHWLGVKPYAQLPAYLACFDVATIPFKINNITHATSPLKLFEYMAGGKPVVITPMQESLRYDGVLSADGPEEFSRRLDEALRLKTNPEYLQRIDRVARENTWEARARLILGVTGGFDGNADACEGEISEKNS
jgi:hypothetical protein